MFTDLKFAFRSLLRTPGFTVVAILTLALGIGMNTAMFSMLNGFLLRPLSWQQSERLFRLNQTRPYETRGDLSASNYLDVADACGEVAEVAGFRFSAFTLSEPNRPADVPIGLQVTSSYFSVLRQTAALGRTFSAEEYSRGRDNVILISHRYWQSHFNGDPAVVGRVVKLDGTPASIVGVLPPDDDTIRVFAPIGIYRPMVWTDAERSNLTDAANGVIGRYRDGVSKEQAATQFQTIAARLAKAHPGENSGMGLVARSLQSTTLGGTARTMTFLLLGLSGFVLLIACANLANLLLARALSRAREFSIRAALGASRMRLIKPLALECLLLAMLGGGAATLVSTWTTDWLAQRFGSPESPVNFSADTRVLAFTMGASFLTAVLFGVGPAWWAARVDINGSLKSATRGATTSRTQNQYRRVLIVTQFALALVLLAGSVFFIRGIREMAGGNPGWRPEPVISGVVNLASAKYNAAEPIIAFHRQLRDKLLELPGVANVAVGFEVPLYNSPAQRGYRVEGRETPAKGEEPRAFTNAVSASFLDTIGMHLRRGRFIDDTDQLKSAPVVVINQTMARALFPNGDAIGHRLGLADGSDPSWAEIVGIVDDVRPLGVAPPPVRFQLYKPFPQEAWQYVTIAVRAQDAALAPSLLEPIRRTVAALDADQPVMRLRTVSDQIQSNLSVWRTINQLLILFAGLGLLLSALGIYGVITRLVLQRTGEIGVRMALGAQMRDIMNLVLGGGFRLAVVGTLIGLLGAVGLGQFLNRTMANFGGSSVGPISIAASVLLTVALVASYFPARRATKVDPMSALRAE